MRRTLAPLFALLLAVFGFALASEADTGIDPVQQFLEAEGYAQLDADEVENAINDLLPQMDSPFLPAGRLSPLAKGAYALKVTYGDLPRTRQHMSITLVPDTQVVLLQLDRYNLGPAIRHQLISSIGEGNVADAEEFGVGPHVSLRVAVTPIIGHQAMIIGASARLVDDAEAEEAFCLVGPCASPAPALAESAFLEPLEEVAVEPTDAYPMTEDGLLTTAAMFDLLATEAGLALFENEALGERGEPFVVSELLLERNLGQEESVDGAILIGEVMDDSIAGIWYRVAALGGWQAGEPVFGAAGYECRRGDPVDGLCP